MDTQLALPQDYLNYADQLRASQQPRRKIIGVPLMKDRIQTLDNGTIAVPGFFTSDNKDEWGDIVTREATEAAIPKYRTWGNIRYMHLPQPVGKVMEIGSDDGLKWNEVLINVVDPKAIFEVQMGLLPALSIGALVYMDKVDFLEDGGWVIHQYDLAEISLVDHPANYDATLNLDIMTPQMTQLRELGREFGTATVFRSIGTGSRLRLPTFKVVDEEDQIEKSPTSGKDGESIDAKQIQEDPMAENLEVAEEVVEETVEETAEVETQEVELSVDEGEADEVDAETDEAEEVEVDEIEEVESDDLAEAEAIDEEDQPEEIQEEVVEVELDAELEAEEELDPMAVATASLEAATKALLTVTEALSKATLAGEQETAETVEEVEEVAEEIVEEDAAVLRGIVETQAEEIESLQAEVADLTATGTRKGQMVTEDPTEIVEEADEAEEAEEVIEAPKTLKGALREYAKTTGRYKN